MTTQQRSILVKLFSQLFPLSNLKETELDWLSRTVSLTHVPANKILFSEEEKDYQLIYLISGSVRLKSVQGNNQTIKSGDPTSKFPIANHHPRKVTGVTVTPSKIICIDKYRLIEQLSRPKVEADTSHEAVGQELLREFQTDLVKDNIKLPTLPDIALDIAAAVKKEDVTVQDVARVIQSDPSVATKIVQIANSAFYRRAVQIESCAHAINLIGIKNTQNFVTSFVLREMFVTKSPLLKKRMGELWAHSTQVAAISYVLALKTPGFEPDRALLAGLIHQIGAISIIHYAEQNPLLKKDKEALEVTIQAHTAKISTLILKKWQFDDELIAVPYSAEDWYRNPDSKADYGDIVMIARLHDLTLREPMGDYPKMDVLPAFEKLAVGQLSPRFSLGVLDEAQEEIDQVNQLLR